MNSSTDLRTIQQNIITHIQKNYHGKIDAMKWESPNDGTHHLLLYRGGEQSILAFTKEDLQSYTLKGWEQRFQEKLKSLIEDDQLRSR